MVSKENLSKKNILLHEDYFLAIEKINQDYKNLYNIKDVSRYISKKMLFDLFKQHRYYRLYKEILLRFSKLISFKNQNKNNFNYSSNLSYNTIINNKKIVVYTCIIGNYDILRKPAIKVPQIDYVVFSDNENLKQNKKGWQYQSIDDEIKKKCKNNPVLINRYIKMHPSEFFENYDYSLYVDGSIQIISDVRKCLAQIKNKSGLAIHSHHSRVDVYEEINACLIQGLGNTEAIKLLNSKYKKENFPKHYGLFEAGIIACDLNNKIAIKILNSWYEEFFKSNVLRDQLILPYVLWKNKLKKEDVGILGFYIDYNPVFRRHVHRIDLNENHRLTDNYDNIYFYKK